MEDIDAKLKLFEFSDKERKIAIDKFLVDLTTTSYEEIKEIIAFLHNKGVRITKAREIKVICNDYNEISKKFSIIESINELDLYREDPNRINKNALDIFKKIKYCIQIGKPYKKEDGKYEKFLFSEDEWQKIFNQTSENVIDKRGSNTFDVGNKELEVVPPTVNDEEVKVFDGDVEKVGEPFTKIRQDLEGLRSQLANLEEVEKSNPSDEISFADIGFNDINPDVYDTKRNSYGRAA